ncbi:molybdopterin molybdotransferase MoeA [Streptomyces sp. NPDC059352]|uniref:molybdopterin molybdotransferase MoeA n=1 Tax=Streptomyces sp. NPDC059352 TaxID=3346810 RepID=UPI00368563A1
MHQMRQWIAAAEAELDIELALDGLRGTAPVTRAADTPRPAPGTGGGSAVHAVAWEQARVRARDSAGRPLPVVVLDLDATLGHALAAPLTALTDLPPFDTSAMDGWAVAGPGPWRLRGGGILAGGQPEPLGRGTAVAIATGARLPEGASAVLRREHGVVETGDGLLIDRSGGSDGSEAEAGPDPEADPDAGLGCGLGASSGPGPGQVALGSGHVAPGRDVRPQGQQCRAGEPLLPAGTTVTPAVLGLAAAAGYDRLAVHRRPLVELLVLGDELLESGPPRDGRVRDALGPFLPPWLRGHGAEVTGRRLVADCFARLRDALSDSTADVVVTTGSTAAGPVNHLHAALHELGARLLVDSVAVRPGHPMLLAELPPAPDGRPRRLVGLPGNPPAAVAGTVTLAVPLLRRLGGHADPEPYRTTVAAALPGHAHDTRLLPVRRVGHEVAPLPFGGPAMPRGLALADGLAVVPPGGVPAGAYAEVLDVPGQCARETFADGAEEWVGAC